MKITKGETYTLEQLKKEGLYVQDDLFDTEVSLVNNEGEIVGCAEPHDDEYLILELRQ